MECTCHVDLHFVTALTSVTKARKTSSVADLEQGTEKDFDTIGILFNGRNRRSVETEKSCQKIQQLAKIHLSMKGLQKGGIDHLSLMSNVLVMGAQLVLLAGHE